MLSQVCPGNYENLPMQYTENFFLAIKIETFIGKNMIFLLKT